MFGLTAEIAFQNRSGPTTTMMMATITATRMSSPIFRPSEGGRLLFEGWPGSPYIGVTACHLHANTICLLGDIVEGGGGQKLETWGAPTGAVPLLSETVTFPAHAREVVRLRRKQPKPKKQDVYAKRRTPAVYYADPASFRPAPTVSPEGQFGFAEDFD
jgi:hypothetical protein